MPANTQTTTGPTAANDSSQGFAPGSIWKDIVTGRTYTCTDATVGASVWTQVSVDQSSRTQPVDPDAAIVRSPAELDALQCVLNELRAIRHLLAIALEGDVGPEDLD